MAKIDGFLDILSGSKLKKARPFVYGLPLIYLIVKSQLIYPRLPPLPPRFDSVLRFSVDKFSSLDFKKLAILSSKFSFGLKLPFERKSLERPSSPGVLDV